MNYLATYTDVSGRSTALQQRTIGWGRMIEEKCGQNCSGGSRHSGGYWKDGRGSGWGRIVSLSLLLLLLVLLWLMLLLLLLV